MQPLGFLSGGNFSEAETTNFDGSVVMGRASVSDGYRMFRWTAATGMQAIGTFDGWAYGMTPDGALVVGQGDFGSGYEAFTWTSEGGVRRLGDVPGGTVYSTAIDVSADGSVVVGQTNSGLGQSNGYEAMVWDNVHGMRTLSSILIAQGADLTGWTLTGASAVSADGMTLIGQGIHSGRPEVYIATIPPVPEPTSISLAGLCTVVILCRTRPKRA